MTSVGIVPRTIYDFSQLRGGPVSFPIAQQVDTEGASSLSLEIHVHDAAMATGSSITVRAAADGSSPDVAGPAVLQTKTSKGDDIAAFVIDSKTVTPLYQIVRIPADEIGRCIAVILEARGGKEAGPKLSLSIDLLLRGGHDLVTPTTELVEPVITRREQEEGDSGAALSKVADAARAAKTRMRPRKYGAWREIVV